MTKDFPHSITFDDSVRKKADRIAALLELDEWWHSFAVGINLCLDQAEAYVKGETKTLFVTPKVRDLLINNEKFIDALCEEGVVEWLTPFVLTKSSQLK